MIANKEIFLLFVVNIISGIGYSLVAPLYPSIAFERGLSEFLIGIIIAVFAVSNLFITPFAHLFFKKIGKKRIFIYSIAAEVILNIMNFKRLFVHLFMDAWRLLIIIIFLSFSLCSSD